ncbi:methionyl-tRNA formyltransferase [candidate division TA06 bacterium]|uniref:Methionyl-tRNA formyltransferase n=1 Tax=candidate division TA06 bacterium TaxID=2250710 RepID=A0A933IE97_UNCT6|nr:methionyl-tRNA formyltransferase [candidate division TA06 bacterium]
MRIVFIGTPAFAVPTLEAIHQKGHEILAVFAQPDRPSGRGRSIAFSPVKQRALELNLPVCQPATLKTLPTHSGEGHASHTQGGPIQTISNLKPDVLVVVAYGLLLPQNILDIPKHGAVNLHPSLLPKYRGAAPINYALLKGDKVTGITSVLMNSKMDAGDIILQEEAPIEADENAGELESRLAKLGADLIVRSLEVMKAGRPEFRKQDESLVTFAPKLSPADGQIDWKRTSAEIQNQVRGMTPKPGAFAMFKEKRLEILETRPENGKRKTENESLPGRIVSVGKDKGPVIKTGDGAVILLKVKPQGKKEMSGRAFVNGYRIAPGQSLGQ